MSIRQQIRYAKFVIDAVLRFFQDCRPPSRCDFNSCGTGVYVSPGVRFHNASRISLGADIYFGPDCSIFGFGGLMVGDGAVIGDNVTVITSNHKFDGPDVDSVPFSDAHDCRPVCISEGAWIGSHAIIRPGAMIGRFVVVGAGAVIGGATEDFGIYAGNPARKIGERSNRSIDGVEARWVRAKRHSIRIVE